MAVESSLPFIEIPAAPLRERRKKPRCCGNEDNARIPVISCDETRPLICRSAYFPSPSPSPSPSRRGLKPRFESRSCSGCIVSSFSFDPNRSRLRVTLTSRDQRLESRLESRIAPARSLDPFHSCPAFARLPARARLLPFGDLRGKRH